MMRLRALTAGLCASTALGLLASSSSAQLLVGADQTANNASIWLIDVNNPGAPQQLLGPGNAAIAWAMAADEGTRTMYFNNGVQLFRSAYGAPLSPVSVGSITLMGTGTQTVSSVTGLAFAGGNLIGFKSTGSGAAFPVGFYTINPANATATLLAAAPSTDFGGFDFDPITGSFYGLNDSTATTTAPGGRGVYRIDNLLSGAPTYTELADYPGTDTDIDGLAAGGGKLYLVNDNSTAGQGIYVFNLTTNMYETALPNPFSNTSAIFSGGAWAPGLIPEPTTVAVAAAMAALMLRRRV